MKNNKLSRMLEPSLGLYSGLPGPLCRWPRPYSPSLWRSSRLVVVVSPLPLPPPQQQPSGKREMHPLYRESVTAQHGRGYQDTMVNSPLPMVIFHPDTDEIIWSWHERFLQLTDGQEHLFDTSLSALVPGFATRWLLEGKTGALPPAGGAG
ncbi:MAG: hypothetical protein ACLRWQ_23290 [Flavonifractor plautii]